MPSQNIHVIAENFKSLEEASEAFAVLQKQFRYFQEHIDVENIISKSLTAEVIKAGSITADEITVTELSALSANLGHIIAGLIESVQIFGSYIATANGTYPRAEMSSIDNFFKAANNANQYVAILPFEVINSAPEVQFVNTPTGSSADLYINPTNGRFNISSPNSIRIASGTGSFIIDTNNVFVGTQQGITGTFYVSNTSGGPATTAVIFTNGIRTS